MSALVRSFFVRSRPVCQKVVRLSTSCLSKRLGSPRMGLTFVTHASSSATSPREADQELVVESYESPKREGKEFVYYHSFMERQPVYKATIFTEQDVQAALRKAPSDISPLLEKTDWSQDSSADLLEAFRSMACYSIENSLSLNDTRFESICQTISSCFHKFSHEELLELGKLISLWGNLTPGHPVAHFRELVKAINDSWVLRYREWFQKKDIANVLKAADISYWMKNGTRSYLRCMVYHMALKIRDPHHMLQLMFYLGMIKPLPTSYKCYDLEKKIYSFKDNYSVLELNLFVHSLFRTKSRLQYHPLLEHLLVQSLKQFSSLDDYMLVTLSKGCNNTPDSLKPLLAVLQRKVLSKINDFKIETVIHVLWMGATNSAVEEELAQAVYERAVKDIGSIRWKELSRLIILFSEHPSPSRDLKHLAECVIAEMTGRKDVQDWIGRKAFILGAVLHRFLLFGLCHRDLLDSYLGTINSNTSASRAFIAKEALAIDVHLEVFYPEYEGIRLCPEIRKEICEERFLSKSKEFKNSDGSKGARSEFNSPSARRMYSDILSIAGSIEENVHLRQMVPSFGYAEFLLCRSKDGNYLPIPKEMKECEPWNLAYIPKNNLENGDQFVAITFFPSQDEFTNKKIVSLQKEKTAILEKLGFIHIEVAENNWRDATPAFKQNALKEIIESRLSQKNVQ